MARASTRATWPSGGPHHPRWQAGTSGETTLSFTVKNKNVHFVNQKYQRGVAMRCPARLKPLTTTVRVQTPGPAPPCCRPLGDGLRWGHRQPSARLVLPGKQT